MTRHRRRFTRSGRFSCSASDDRVCSCQYNERQCILAEQQMKISVITAAYNSQATIASTIESFLGQTHPDKEMLVIDGASKDDTLKIVESFGSPDIRVLSETDKGG